MIRPLDLADLATARALLELQRRAYRVEAELIGYDRIPPLVEELPELQACGEEFHGWVEGQALRAAISWRRSGAELDLHRLVVDPACFRRGLGRRLVRWAVSRPGIERLIVSTGEANGPARRLYESEGFELLERVQLEERLAIVRYARRAGPSG